MNKFKFIIVRVWFIILFVAIFIGVNRILSFDKYGFLSLIFTIGSVIITLYLFSRENEEKTEKILKNAKIIYSLNYTNLKNKTWDSNIINMIGKIHEAKARQELYLSQKPDELNKLVELSKIHKILHHFYHIKLYVIVIYNLVLKEYIESFHELYLKHLYTLQFLSHFYF